MGRIITREVGEKIITLIKSEDSTNWSLALYLLRGLEGLSNDDIEEWFYLKFEDHWKNKIFWYDHYGCKEFLENNMSKPHRMVMNVDLSELFIDVNSYRRQTRIKKYRWKLDGK